MDQIVEQIRLLFNPSLIVETSNTTTASAFIVQETDNSDFDLEDREDRIIRKTFTISLEGYIPNPKFLLTSTGEIEEFIFKVLFCPSCSIANYSRTKPFSK